jgi:hypothetical protein
VKGKTWQRVFALLGEAADGRHEKLDFSQTTTPYHIRIETNPKGEIILRNNDKWRVNEYKDFALSGDDLVNEAKVALAMQGRGHRGSHLQTSWLEKFPNSISLASYAAWGVMGSVESKMGLIFEDGETDEEPNDTVHERTLNYIVNAIEYWLPQVHNEAQFHHVDYVLSYLFLPHSTRKQTGWRDPGGFARIQRRRCPPAGE